MKRKLALALLSLLCALALAGSQTFAWLSKTSEPEEKIYTVLSDFEIKGTLSFGGNPYVSDDKGDIMVPIGLTPGSENYIGEMKYEVTYSGLSPAYLRVRVIEQWLDRATGEIMSVPYMAYAITGDVENVNPANSATLPAAGSSTKVPALAESGVWVDHRKVDYAYYYSVPVQPKLLVNTGEQNAAVLSDGAVKFTLINQHKAGEGSVNPIPEGVDPATTDLSLLIQAEAVQPNRFREFWRIDAIPQPFPPASDQAGEVSVRSVQQT